MDKALRAVLDKTTVTEIAAACGITSQAVSQWDKVPANRVRAVSKLTGIPQHQLRPDLIDPPAKASAA